MRYRVLISRVQILERSIRAASEEDVAKRIQEELDRPYGYLGSWRTVHTDLEIVEAESSVDGNPPPVAGTGSLLLSVKNAAAYLGISTSQMYDLVNAGEVAHVAINTRKYVSRDALNAFIEAHSHLGAHHRSS
jgi:excisionase family DNA binding protein